MEPPYPLIGLALVFDFLNGFHGSSNIVATVISSRAMSSRMTLLLASLAVFCGPFIFGVAVSKTLGDGLLRVQVLNTSTTVAALLAAVVWNLITWHLGMPSSSSHALAGGLLGAAIVTHGPVVVQLAGLSMVLIALLASPPLGMLAGALGMRLTLWASRSASPKINTLFRRLQVPRLVGLALSHGTNDGAGAAERLSKVRWTVMSDMLVAWLLTIPATAAMGALAATLLGRL